MSETSPLSSSRAELDGLVADQHDADQPPSDAPLEDGARGGDLPSQPMVSARPRLPRGRCGPAHPRARGGGAQDIEGAPEPLPGPRSKVWHAAGATIRELSLEEAERERRIQEIEEGRAKVRLDVQNQ